MLKSSTEILRENNARRLLKRVQIPEILINNMSVNMSDYFINTLYITRKLPRKKNKYVVLHFGVSNIMSSLRDLRLPYVRNYFRLEKCWQIVF